MATSNAIGAVGLKFYRKDPTSGIYETLAEVTSVSGPTKTRETIDVTNFDSDGGYREFVASFRDGGEVSLDMNFTNATYKKIDEDFDSDDKNQYRITFPDTSGSKLDFYGLVTGNEVSASVDDKVSASVTIKVSGQPVFSDDL
jgi:predicted secreted protein